MLVGVFLQCQMTLVKHEEIDGREWEQILLEKLKKDSSWHYQHLASATNKNYSNQPNKCTTCMYIPIWPVKQKFSA